MGMFRGSCDVPELVELQTEVAKLKVDLEKVLYILCVLL